MEIQYAVMIDTRVDELTGPAEDFLSNLQVTRLNTAPVFGLFAHKASSTYFVEFYASEDDRTARQNALLSWELTYSTTYTNRAFAFADRTAGTVTISNVTAAKLLDTLYFQIHRTTYPDIGLYNGSFCWITGTPNFGVSGPIEAHSPVFTNPAAKFLRLVDKTAITWAAKTPPASHGAIYGLAWSGSLFVGVTNVGGIMTSPDATTWTARTSGIATSLRSVAWSPKAGCFIAAGAGGVILSSPNGITWTSRISTTSADLSGAYWVVDRFIVTGASGTLRSSFDGITWTTITSGTSEALQGIAWTGSLYVLVGSNGLIRTSPDLTTWTTQTSGVGAVLNRVLWAGNQIVIVGSSGVVLTSATGTTWTARTSGTATELRGVAWDGSKYLAAGHSGTLLTSPDAITWTARTSGTALDLYTPVWGGTRFVVSGNTTLRVSEGTFTTAVYASEANRAAGTSALASADLSYANVAGLVTLSDQLTFQLGSISPANLPADLEVGVPVYKATGLGAGFITSFDLLNTLYRYGRFTEALGVWKPRSIIAGRNLTSITYGNGAYVAVGPSGTIVRSVDGEAWYGAATPGFSSGIDIQTVLFANGLFLAAGTSGRVYKSTDGNVWEQASTGLHPSCTVRALAWNGTRFLAVGESTIGSNVSSSTDGTTWTDYANSAIEATYAATAHGTVFVLVGNSGKVYTSSTGLISSWTQRTTGTPDGSYRAVSSNGSRLVAVGLSGLIRTSDDSGVTWTSRTSTVTSHLRGVAWGGTRFLAVGASGQALKSVDGITWVKMAQGASSATAVKAVSGKFFVVGDKGSLTTTVDGFYTTLYASAEDRAVATWPRASAATAFTNLPSAGIPDFLELQLTGFDLADLPTSLSDEGTNFDLPITVLNSGTGLPQRTWKEGLIAKESLGSPSMSVDPSLGGSYSSMSGMDAKVVNMVSGLFNTPADPALAAEPMSLGEFLRQKDILLHRCKFRFYQVEKGEFQLVNTFLIEDVVEDDQFISLQCADTWLSIHKDMPKRAISSKTFPDAPQDSIGQVIPLCIGWVPEAKLVPLNGNIRRTEFAYRDNKPIYTTRGIEYSDNVLTVKTDQTIKFNALQNKFIRITRTGVTIPTETYVNTILANASSSGGKVRLTLKGPFKKANGDTLKIDVNTKDTQKAFWFQVYDFQDFRAVSDGPIAEFAGPLKGWSDAGEFIDISRKTRKLYPAANSDFAPAAGILLRPEGDALPLQPLDYVPTSMFDVTAAAPTSVLKDAKIVAGIPEFPFPAVSYPSVQLRDGNIDTWNEKVSTYTFTAKAGNSIEESVPVRCVFPPSFSLEADETLYVGLDADLLLGSSAHNRYIRAHLVVRLVDVFESPASAEKRFDNFWSNEITVAGGTYPLGSGGMLIRQIGSFYYDGAAGDLAKCIELPVEITNVLKNKEARESIRGLEIQLRMVTRMAPFTVGSSPVKTGVESVVATYRIREVALFQKRDAYTGDQYVAVKGVTFGTGWPGKIAAAAVTSLPDAIEYIIRRQDDASTHVEPLSFDFCRRMVFTNGDWEIGRQITEGANSVDYIEELCRHGFCSIVPGRDGKRRLLPIHGYDTFLKDPTFPVNRNFSGKNILVGSFKDSRILGMDRVYTGLTLRYDYNPASEEFRKVITVRNTQSARFPQPEENVPGTGNPTIPLWTTFVGGVEKYEDAKALWGAEKPNVETGFRKAYLVSQRENILELECPWFISDEHFDGTQGKGAFNLARILSQWFAVPRVDYSFRVPASPYNLDLYLLQRITVRDDVRTNGYDYMAIITGLELDPVASEIEVSCQRLLTDKPYNVPVYLYEGIMGEPVRAPETDVDGNKVDLIGTNMDIEEVSGGDTLLETFYP